MDGAAAQQVYLRVCQYKTGHGGETEREREREHACLFIYALVYMCVHKGQQGQY